MSYHCFLFLSSDNVLLDLLNHPVHILDDDENLSPSAFIPFCSFQDIPDPLSKEYGNFSNPVCSSFKKRILDGQLCYQIDVNIKINETTMTGPQKGGLSFLVDVNAEYDLTRELFIKLASAESSPFFRVSFSRVVIVML